MWHNLLLLIIFFYQIHNEKYKNTPVMCPHINCKLVNRFSWNLVPGSLIEFVSTFQFWLKLETNWHFAWRSMTNEIMNKLIGSTCLLIKIANSTNRFTYHTNISAWQNFRSLLQTCLLTKSLIIYRGKRVSNKCREK